MIIRYSFLNRLKKSFSLSLETIKKVKSKIEYIAEINFKVVAKIIKITESFK